MGSLIYKEDSFKVIGICMEIHSLLGMGLKEMNYKDAMEIEFNEQEVPYEREVKFDVMYKGFQLPHPYYADFVLFDSFVVEVKSVTSIAEVHVAQTISYLSISKLKLGIIINFGERSLKWKRVIL